MALKIHEPEVEMGGGQVMVYYIPGSAGSSVLDIAQSRASHAFFDTAFEFNIDSLQIVELTSTSRPDASRPLKTSSHPGQVLLRLKGCSLYAGPVLVADGILLVGLNRGRPVAAKKVVDSDGDGGHCRVRGGRSPGQVNGRMGTILRQSGTGGQIGEPETGAIFLAAVARVGEAAQDATKTRKKVDQSRGTPRIPRR
jgi:hypothetical protein